MKNVFLLTFLASFKLFAFAAEQKSSNVEEEDNLPNLQHNFESPNIVEDHVEEDLIDQPSGPAALGINHLESVNISLCSTFLNYLDEKSLFQLALADSNFGLIYDSFETHKHFDENSKMAALNVKNVLLFISECTPALNNIISPEFRARPFKINSNDGLNLFAILGNGAEFNPLSEIQAPGPANHNDEHRLATVSRTLGFNSLADVPNSKSFLQNLIAETSHENIPLSKIVIFAYTGMSIEDLLGTLVIDLDCRNKLIYEHLLNFIPDLNSFRKFNNEHIILALISRNVYLPTQMERPELNGTSIFDDCLSSIIFKSNFSAFKELINLSNQRFRSLTPEDLNVLSLIFFNPEGPAEIFQLISRLSSNNDVAVSVSREIERLPNLSSQRHELMAILANFMADAGQHQEIFRMLYKTGKYDMINSMGILFANGNVEELRLIKQDLPEVFNNSYPWEYCRIIQPISLEMIELFMLPHLTVFKFFSLISSIDFAPTKKMLDFINEKDPECNACDNYGNDLLLHALRLKSNILVEICINRPCTSAESIKRARQFALTSIPGGTANITALWTDKMI